MDSQHKATLRRRYTVMALFLVLIWGAVAFDYYDRHYLSQDIKSNTTIMRVWGVFPREKGKPDRVHVIAKGGSLVAYQDGYRLAAMCFYHDGTKDYLDVENLQKSALFDIQDADMQIIFPVKSGFLEEGRKSGRLINYFLFLIPKEVKMDQFSTIRQANALGVIQLSGGAGLP